MKRGRRITVGAIRKMEQAGIEYVQLDSDEIIGKITAEAINDSEGNEIVPINEELNCRASGLKLLKRVYLSLKSLFIDGVNADASFRNTLSR